MRKPFLVSIALAALLLSAAILYFLFGLQPKANAAVQGKSTGRKVRTGADKVTLAGRDTRKKLIQLTIHSEADRASAYGMGTLIEDYGSFVVVSVDEKKNLLAASSSTGVQEIETAINLPGRSFDPLKDVLPETNDSADRLLSESDGDGGYYLVQFVAPARDEWLEEISAAGARVLQYVPNQAFFVYASREAMATIAAHPRVRWTGAFDHSYKLSPEIGRRILQTQTGVAEGKEFFDVAVFAIADLKMASRTVTEFGATILNEIVLPNNYFNVLRVRMEAGLALSILQIPGVITIDPYVAPSPEDERSSQIVAGNFISSTQLASPGYNSLAQFGVDGTGVTVAVVDDGIGIPGDGGFYITTSNAVTGPLRGSNQGIVAGHGHLNGTIIAGDLPFSALDSLGYNYGMGIARKSNIINIPLLVSGYAGTEADTCNDTVTTAGPNGVKGFISNNSWGSGTNSNVYDSLAAQYDGFVRDSSSAATIDPLVIVFSAGNQGASGLTRPKMSKNTIAVASSKNIRTELSASANNLDDLSSFSSRGPASDGRIKPDITAPGEGISGGRAGLNSLFGNIDEYHRWSSGTSHSAPQIAGAAALFTQFWKNNNGGNNPSPALVKAALINGTQDMTGTLATAAIPNGNEGWGRLNLQNVLNTGVGMKYVNQTRALATVGEEFSVSGTVASTGRHFRVSLVWTDPPGVSDPALVNNLDLEVNVGGNVYRGNVFSGGISITGGTSDIRNNVENVFLPAGIAAGTAVTIRVRAAGLNGDGILGNGDPTDQHFALVAFNFNETSCAFSLNPGSQNFSSAGGNGSVNLTTTPGCAWSVTSNAAWLIPSVNGGTGSGTVNFTVSANSGNARAGTLTIGDQNFTVNQDSGCSFMLNSSSLYLLAAGGNGTVNVTANSNCSWTAVSNDQWITVNSFGGQGNGSASFSVAANADATIRTGSLTIAGQNFTITQAGTGLMYYPLPKPVRLFDTRAPISGFAACEYLNQRLTANGELVKNARINCDGVVIPPNAAAITGNATIVNPDTAGFATLWPDGQPLPPVSNLNFVAGQVVPNSVTVRLSEAGNLRVYSTANTDFILDITGYFAPPAANGLYYHPLPAPIRLFDMRAPIPGFAACEYLGQPLAANSELVKNARINCNGNVIPTDALAITGNATVVNPLANGFAIIWPDGQNRPVASNLNFNAGQIVANAFTIGLSQDGNFRIYSTASASFIIDITGYFSASPMDVNGLGLFYSPLPQPIRLFDTRAPITGFAACEYLSQPLAANSELIKNAHVVCNGYIIPNTARAISGNSAAVVPANSGYIILWPDGQNRPPVSNLNYLAGQIVPNSFTLGLGNSGGFRIFSVADTNFIVDVNGYFAP